MQNVNKKLEELKKQFTGEEIEAALHQSNMYAEFTKSPPAGKLRLLASLTKMGGALSGSSTTAGIGLIAQQMLKKNGVKENTQNSQIADARKKTYDGSLQDNASAVVNMGSGIKNSATGLAATGLATGLINPTSIAALTSPTLALSHLAGGVGSIGAGLGSIAGLSLGGIPAVALGMAGLLGAGKGAKGFANWAGKGSANKTPPLNTITFGPSASQLEQTYGSTSHLQAKIKMFATQGMMTPAEATTANILAMIEGHTSVIPLIAEASQKDSGLKNNEGGNKAHNILEDEFTSDGTMFISDKSKERQTLFKKLITGLEVGATNLPGVFDLPAQFENLFKLKSSTALYDEINDKNRLDDPLLPEKQFGSKFGISVGMVQAIHTTPSQIMQQADTYESKTLAVLGLLTEINRFQAHELLKIRTDGFGITTASSAGYLGDMREEQYLKQQAELSIYEEYGFKSIVDQTIGRIPILASGVNAIKGVSAGANFISDLIHGEKEKNEDGSIKRDSNGKIVRKEQRSFKEFMKDMIVGDIENKDLKNEEKLRKKIGAVELGPEKLMSHYLGEAYPSRFELLLEYNLSQKESLEALVGPIKRAKNTKLTMNKYTGKFGNDTYHKAKEKSIRDKLAIELETTNKSGNIISDFLGNIAENDSTFIDRQTTNARKENAFLNEILGGVKQKGSKNMLGKGLYNPMLDGPEAAVNKGQFKFNLGQRDKTDKTVEDIQHSQIVESREVQKLKFMKIQTEALTSISKCLDCGKKSTKTKKNKDSKDSDDSGVFSFIKGAGAALLAGGTAAIARGVAAFGAGGAAEALIGTEGAAAISAAIPAIGAAVGVALVGYAAFELGGYLHDKFKDTDIVKALDVEIGSNSFLTNLFGTSGNKAIDKDNGLNGYQKTREDNWVNRIDSILDQKKLTVSKIASKYLNHKSKGDLLYIMQENQSSFDSNKQLIAQAAALQYEKLTKNSYIDAQSSFDLFYDGSHYIDHNTLSGIGDNKFRKSALTEMKNMTPKELIKLYTKEHKNFEGSMNTQFGNILNDAYLKVQDPEYGNIIEMPNNSNTSNTSNASNTSSIEEIKKEKTNKKTQQHITATANSTAYIAESADITNTLLQKILNKSVEHDITNIAIDSNGDIVFQNINSIKQKLGGD